MYNISEPLLLWKVLKMFYVYRVEPDGHYVDEVDMPFDGSRKFVTRTVVKTWLVPGTENPDA